MADYLVQGTILDSEYPPRINAAGNIEYYDGKDYVDSGRKAPFAKDLADVMVLLEALKDGKLNDFPELEYLTRAFANAKAINTGAVIAGVILFTKLILPPNPTDEDIANARRKITAYAQGDANANQWFLRAGVKHFGTPEEIANAGIRHDGTGHMGEIYFDHDTVRIGDSDNDVLGFGSGLADDHEKMSDTLTKNYANRIIPFFYSPDYRKLLFGTRYLSSDYFGVHTPMAKLSIKLDVSINSVNRGEVMTVILYTENTPVPYAKIWEGTSAGSYTKTLDVPRGYYYLVFSLSNGEPIYRHYVSGTIEMTYASGKRWSMFTPHGFRAFGDGENYLDLDYDRRDGVFAQLAGGLKLDYIETSGAVLAGGEVSEYGGVTSPFGKYYNKYGITTPLVEKLGSGQSCYFRVWHSINSTAYVPFVTPNKVPWSDQASIVNKQANYFDVRFYNGSGQSYYYPFNYVCYRAG